jgi:F0F1-type ATP synthase assembly protein I
MITGVAVLLAISIPAVRTLTQHQVRARVFLEASLIVGGLTSILGALIGLFHYRRWRGLSWGLLVGAVIGVCVGPLVLSREYGQVVGSCLGGSLLLLILAVLFRARD